MHDTHKVAVAGTECVNFWLCDRSPNHYDTLSPAVTSY